MPVVLIKDALDTNCLRASSTEILNQLLRVPTTINLAQVVKLVIEDTKLRCCILLSLLLLFLLYGRVALDQSDKLLVLAEPLQISCRYLSRACGASVLRAC